MKILHISTFLQGGAGKVVVDLAKDSINRGHKVSIACTENPVVNYSNYPGHVLELKRMRIPLFFINSTFSRDLSRNLHACRELSKNGSLEGVDLIHSHASIPSLVSLFAKSNGNTRIPVVQTMHGWGIYKNEKQEKQDISILNLVDHVVTISESSRDLLVSKGFKKSNLSVIYNGIETTRTPQSVVKDKDLCQLKQFKKEGYKIVGVVGTVDERKNQKILIEAVRFLPPAIKARFFIIGEGKAIHGLKSICKNYGLSEKIFFTNYKKNGMDFIKSFDCLLSCSISEGGPPLCLMEAFAERIPVIASSTAEHKEAVFNFENGFIFKSQDAEDLANVLQLVLDKEDLSALVDQAYQHYLEYYTFNNTAAAYRKLYRKTLQKL